MQLHLLRLFLLPTRAPEFWTEAEDRQAYLVRVFSSECKFMHRGEQFVYVFVERVDERIVGRIGREIERPTNEPPEKALVPKIQREWRASTIILDPSSGPDGQLVYAEHNSLVGAPIALLRSLCDALNEAKPVPPWTISVNPISDEQDFWRVAAHYQGSITELTFVFLPPNMFGTSDSFDEELRRMRDEEQIDQLETSLRNKAGRLNPNTPRVERAMHEVARGSARAVMKAKRRKVYDSDSKVRKISVDNSVLADLKAFVSTVFGSTRKRDEE